MTARDQPYVRRYYGVPAKKGMRVIDCFGMPGVITGFRDAYVLVRLDGEKRSAPYHPAWRMTYLGKSGEILAKYGD